MSRIIIIGAGAAGSMAAYQASINGHQVCLIEKNEKIGKKIFITGKGRCNVTNNCEPEVFFDSILSNKKFLYSAYYGFDCNSTMDFFENSGIALKTERGNRVFPVSDHSSDIIKGLEKSLRSKRNIEIKLNTLVESVFVKNNTVKGVYITSNGNRSFLPADKVLIATGGLSYPSTGSTGDGYKFARSLNIDVTDTYPGLVPLEVKEAWIKELQGLSLKNVEITLLNGKKKLYSDFGEMLFTHFGLSGPLILSASSYIKNNINYNELTINIDLKPAISSDILDKRIIKEFEANNNKLFKNILSSLYPSKLIPVMIALSGIDPNKPVHDINRTERENLVRITKCLTLHILKKRDFNEAIITKGGISVKEIDPSTMESKKIKGLFFAGEVIDLDALTGGFNLQIAWSTGALAGRSF